MIIYEITAIVNSDLAESFEQFMKEKHIPDLLETGHFRSAEIASFSSNFYRIRYEVISKTALDKYLDNDAERLRQDFLSHFPEGVELTREVLGVLQTWNAD